MWITVLTGVILKYLFKGSLQGIIAAGWFMVRAVQHFSASLFRVVDT